MTAVSPAAAAAVAAEVRWAVHFDSQPSRGHTNVNCSSSSTVRQLANAEARCRGQRWLLSCFHVALQPGCTATIKQAEAYCRYWQDW